MLVTGNAKTTVLKGTTFVDTLLGWGVRQNADGSVTEDITKVAHESMFGNSGNDKLYGGAGNDKLYGEVGNDVLNGGSGNDFLDGGSGTDTAIFKSSAVVPGDNGTEKVIFISPEVVASFGWVNGKLTVTSSEGVDTLVNIEYLQFGGQTFKITDVPIANNDSIVATENLLDVAASALLANDFSAMSGGPPLAIQTGFSGVVGQTDEGVNIYLGGDGRLHFAANETGYDYLAEGETLATHFSYSVGNGNGLTDSADVELTITGEEEVGDFTVSASGNSRSVSSLLSAYNYITGLTIGANYTVQVDRLEGDLDPAMWVYSGHLTDQSITNLGFSSLSTSIPGYLGYGDDDIPPNIPGPYMDPQITFTATSTEITVITTNFASGPNTGGDGMFDFSIMFY